MRLMPETNNYILLHNAKQQDMPRTQLLIYKVSLWKWKLGKLKIHWFGSAYLNWYYISMLNESTMKMENVLQLRITLKANAKSSVI